VSDLSFQMNDADWYLWMVTIIIIIIVFIIVTGNTFHININFKFC